MPDDAGLSNPGSVTQTHGAVTTGDKSGDGAPPTGWNSLRHFPMKPCFGKDPNAIGGSRRDIKSLCDLDQRQSGEVSHLHQLGSGGVLCTQLR